MDDRWAGMIPILWKKACDIAKKKNNFIFDLTVHVSFVTFHKRFFPVAGKYFYASHGAPNFFLILVRVITLQESGKLRWVNRESKAEWSKVNRSFSQ